MPFGLGFFATAGVSAAGGSYELIASEILTSSQASVTFSNLGDYASTYQHLQIRYTGRSTRAAGSDNLGMRLNSVTSASYSHHRLYGDGSSVNSYSTGALNTLMLVDTTPANTATGSLFSAGVIDILDPYETKNKTVRILSGSVNSLDNAVVLTSGAYYSTNSSTTIDIFALNGNLAQYSRFSLYGIKGA